ncbi:hypothetical protein E2C01_035480 [Portunus trituberculatus]|uniref:Reverse transcriptase domain-containing protein n=1 Tax=Portunus trituberculatus TaxID=210409 RepID=A0A5B7FBL2_PORTR|nr:hypothetical protein [Portunus trituberculatus]
MAWICSLNCIQEIVRRDAGHVVLGAFAGLSSAAPQRGLDCLGALARANLDIMQPCEMLHLRMMMLRRQAVIASGLASTARASQLRLVVPLVSDALHRFCFLRFRPLLLLRDPPTPMEFPVYRGGSDHNSALEASTGGWRSICDLSVLNRFLMVTHFRMETISSVLESMAEGEWMVSLDLLDAYYQGAWRQDAFSFLWDGVDLYAFPPFALIRRVLVRVRESQAVRMTLVAPLWPQADWFPLLLDLLMDSPRVLPMWQSLLRQPHRPLFHGSPEKLHLHMWRLSSVSSECEIFHTRLLSSCLVQSGSPPPQFTRRSEESFVVGSGIDLSTDPDLSSLFCSFVVSCPPRLPRLPAWNLSLVLWSLLRPYEPLRTASLRDVLFKTVFLLVLASAHRVSGLHSLSTEVRHSKGWTSMTFSFAPDFLAKTQCPGQHSFDEFTIPGLLDFVGRTR